MSYILDALRRADAERERGAVPGLHAHSLPPDAEPAARDYRPLAWAAGGAGALLVAVVVVLVFAPWRSQPAPGAVAAAAPAVQGSTPTLTAPPAVTAQVPPTASGETPAAVPGGLAPAALPVAPPLGQAAAPAAVSVDRPEAARARLAASQSLAARAADPRVAQRAAQGRVGVVTPAPGGSPAEVPAQDAAVARAPAAEHYGAPLPTPATPLPTPAAPLSATPVRAAANAVVGINDLPAATRAALPRLAVGGAIYSDVPSARMLILNGQVWHEGEKPAADTVLEQIRHKSAVLNWRGTRYEITF